MALGDPVLGDGEVARGRVSWPDDVQAVMSGDLTAGAAYLTTAGGAVLTGVAPCGSSDPKAGTVGYTTSLGFSKKLHHIVRNPRVALAYHSREHGFASSSQFVLVQGTASVELLPSRERLDAFMPSVKRFMGELKRGRLWDPLLHAYYYERVFVDIAVERVVVWPDLTAGGKPAVYGSPLPGPPESQSAPRKGTAPRIDIAKAVRQVSSLPHRLVAYRGSDGYPVVAPIEFGGHDKSGFHLIAAHGLLPTGARRAGVLAHSYRPQLIGLSTRSFTGWLRVSDDGTAVYAPHTSVGYTAPPKKRPLLVINGVMATLGLWRAQRSGTARELERLAVLHADETPR
jgi:hypothetical protein